MTNTMWLPKEKDNRFRFPFVASPPYENALSTGAVDAGVAIIFKSYQ